MSNNNRAVGGGRGGDHNNDLFFRMIRQIAPLVGPLVANRLIQALLGLNLGWAVTRRVMEAVYNTLRRHCGLIVGSALSTAGLAVLAPSLCVAIVNAIGFTQGGVLAGSIAASLQSIFYGGATGGIFSALQSFGATAAIASPVVLAIGGTGLAIGAGCLLWSWWKRRGGNDGGEGAVAVAIKSN
ncbi:hypothetical protein CVT26_002654 [Gymnopilus dilepis]|uniref:Uncharacterized protein n=1 Tax=Gymnopilus dilepis TaxID=231916 RepID=A0A409VCL8_9AGAR|nr:hypothetical protein CVT26_002654 [Gymnopilus dilepis]